MKPYSLARTGQSNIEFTGVKLAEAKSPAHRRHVNEPKANNYWFESTVYQTKGGKFIVAINYRWAGKLNRENAQDFAHVFANLDLAKASLAAFVPQDCITGYPPGDFWADKQKLLLQSIGEDFDMLVEMIEDQLVKLAEPEHVE